MRATRANGTVASTPPKFLSIIKPSGIQPIWYNRPSAGTLIENRPIPMILALFEIVLF